MLVSAYDYLCEDLIMPIIKKNVLSMNQNVIKFG